MKGCREIVAILLVFLVVVIPFNVVVLAEDTSFSTEIIKNDENRLGNFGKVIPIEENEKLTNSINNNLEKEVDIIVVAGVTATALIASFILSPEIALFSVVALVLVPVFSLKVDAAASVSLTQLSVTGEDGIKNYVRRDESSILFSATAYIYNDTTISNNQVILRNRGEMSCSSTANAFEARCLYLLLDPRFSDVNNYTIDLRNDNNITIWSQGGTFYRDTYNAAITSFSLTNNETSGITRGGVTVYNKGFIIATINAQDKAYSNSSASVCAGLKEVKESHSYFTTKTFSSPNDCSETLTLSRAITSFSEGLNNITIVVKDYFDQGTNQSKTFIYDKTGPMISSNSLKFEKNGNSVRYIPENGLDNIRMSINVTDSYLSSVTANVTNLSAGIRTLTCNPLINNTYSCYIDISIKISSDNPRITINATDDVGNEEVAEIMTNLKFDNKTGSVLGISTPFYVQNKYYIREKNNTFIVAISKEGAGYNDKKVYLDLSQIGASSKLQADNCTGSGSSWSCVFNSVDTSGLNDNVTKQVKVHSDSQDDIGNKITNYTVNVTLDKINPEISEISINPRYPTASQEPLIISFNVTEKGSGIGSVTVNASNISSNDLLNANCNIINSSGGLYGCRVEVYSLVTENKVGQISIYVSDIVQNYKIKTTSIQIYQAEENTEPNCFDVDDNIEVIPDAIDRNVASRLSMKLFVHPTFLSLGCPNSAITSIEVTNCNTTYMSFDSIMNEDQNDPYFIFELSTATGYIQENHFTVDCNVSLGVKSDKTVYLKKEIENVKINVSLYNNPLGDINDTARDKLSAILDEIDDVQAEIDSWEQWTTYLDLICGIAHLLGKINSALQSIKAFIYGIACGLKQSWILYPLGVGLAKTMCDTLDKFHGFVNYWIWPTGMVPIPPMPGHFFKYACMIYACKLCAADTWIGLTIESAASGFNAYTQDTGFTDFLNEGQVTGGTNWYAGRRTKLQSLETAEDFVTSSTWIWDPYRSIDYAGTCLCIPGLIYGLKKQRQILCMKYTCVETNAGSGLDTSVCDQVYAERECLYVTGAAAELTGTSFIDLFLDIINTIIENLAALSGMVVYITYCNDYFQYMTAGPLCYADAADPSCTGDTRRTICGVTGTALALLEIGDILGSTFSIESPNVAPEGTDYCEGVPIDEE